MATLAEIRAKLQQSAQQAGGGAGGDNAIFPHWNIQEGTTVTVRFLPDGDIGKQTNANYFSKN